MVILEGHSKRVGIVAWHPTARNVLLSAGSGASGPSLPWAFASLGPSYGGEQQMRFECVFCSFVHFCDARSQSHGFHTSALSLSSSTIVALKRALGNHGAVHLQKYGRLHTLYMWPTLCS